MGMTSMTMLTAIGDFDFWEVLTIFVNVNTVGP